MESPKETVELVLDNQLALCYGFLTTFRTGKSDWILPETVRSISPEREYGTIQSPPGQTKDYGVYPGPATKKEGRKA